MRLLLPQGEVDAGSAADAAMNGGNLLFFYDHSECVVDGGMRMIGREYVLCVREVLNAVGVLILRVVRSNDLTFSPRYWQNRWQHRSRWSC